MPNISDSEYALMRAFIEEHCGIHLTPGKEYLIESRLTGLLRETGCRSFRDFHAMARKAHGRQLRDQIVDAMTTNETLWFRDERAWNFLREVVAPNLIAIATQKGRARIWSCAASTGQEPYSILMLLNETLGQQGKSSLLNRFDILATDISASAINQAREGCYDEIAMSRGLPEHLRQKYFTRQAQGWRFDPFLKRRVRFERFNLQDSFSRLGTFDLILCRYVIIYFSSVFKKEILDKLSKALNPGGILLLGATESIREFDTDFKITCQNGTVVHQLHGP